MTSRLVAALAIMAVASPALAQGDDLHIAFESFPIFTETELPRSVFPVDLDDDGDLDAVSVSQADSLVHWHESDGGIRPSFVTHEIGQHFSATDVFVADIDGDGDCDIAVAASNSAGLSWYKSDGAADPTFTLQTLADPVTDAAHVFLADIDGDGDCDMAVTTTGLGAALHWYENDGAAIPSFTKHTPWLAPNHVNGLFVIDMDADADLDIITTASDTLFWHENDGAMAPTFTTRVISASAIAPRNVFCEDLNADGAIDVMTASSGRIYWFESDGQQPPAFTQHTLFDIPGGGWPSAVFAVDFDGDGDQDAISSTASINAMLRWHESDGASPPTFTHHDIGDGPVDLMAADMDADGDTDILTAHISDGSIRWIDSDLFRPSSLWNNNQGIAPGSFENAINDAESGDVIEYRQTNTNSNFELDLLAGAGATEIIFRVRGDLIVRSVLLERDALLADNSVADIGPARTLTLGEATIPIGGLVDEIEPGEIRLTGESWLGDDSLLRADSTLALAVGGTLTLDNGATCTIDSGAGAEFDGDLVMSPGSLLNITGGPALLAGVPEFTKSIVWGDRYDVHSIVAADLDGDGDDDIVSGSAIDNDVRWFRNDGAANPVFESLDIDDDVAMVRSVFAADMDEDGDIDVLAASEAESSIYWYENDGAPTPSFAAHTIFSSAAGAFDVLAADMNGDGFMDVVSASYIDHTIRWFESDGMDPPSFTTHTLFGAANHVVSIDAIDFDLDGDMDLLSASKGDDLVRWYENDGMDPPSFTPHEIYSELEEIFQPHAVTSGDVDGDGDIDAISVAQFPETLYWHENDGLTPPSFTTHEIPLEDRPQPFVSAADLDGDGDLDIITADPLTWHENNGQSPPEFRSRTIDAFVFAIRSVAIADFTGDGNLDVANATETLERINLHRTSYDALDLPFGSILAAENSIINRRQLTSGGSAIIADNGFTNNNLITGDADIDADTTNNGEFTFLADSIIRGDFTNNELTSIQNGTLTILGALTNNGSIIGDINTAARGSTSNSGLFVQGDFTLSPEATLSLSPGAQLALGADFDSAANQPARFDLSGAALKMTALPEDAPQSLEAMSPDLGANVDLELVEFRIDTIRIGPTATAVNIVDAHNNNPSRGSAPEAIYTRNLTIDPNATLNTNGHTIYYESLALNGAVDNPSNLIQLASACPWDLDANGDVGAVDIAILLSNWGVTSAQGDFNNDGVNALDLATLLSYWGPCP